MVPEPYHVWLNVRLESLTYNPVGGGLKIEAGMVGPAGEIRRIDRHDRRRIVPAAQDQHRAAAGGVPGKDVGHAVAYEEAGLQIEPVLGGGLDEHARSRLAARAGHAIFRQRGLGVMGAIVDGVQPRAATALDLLEDQAIQVLQFAFADQAPGDDRLVADDGQEHPRRFEPPERGGHALQQADLLGADQKAPVVDQHAVAIEKYGPAKGGHHFGAFLVLVPTLRPRSHALRGNALDGRSASMYDYGAAKRPSSLFPRGAWEQGGIRLNRWQHKCYLKYLSQNKFNRGDAMNACTRETAAECDLSLFVACYNEEEAILPTLQTVLAALNEVGCSYDIVVVDDASKDRSVPLIKQFIAEHPEVPLTLVVNEFNQGLGVNYVEAAFLGRGRYYRAICGDDVESKETLVSVFRRLGEADIILSYHSDASARHLVAAGDLAELHRAGQPVERLPHQVLQRTSRAAALRRHALAPELARFRLPGRPGDAVAVHGRHVPGDPRGCQGAQQRQVACLEVQESLLRGPQPAGDFHPAAGSYLGQRQIREAAAEPSATDAEATCAEK